MAGRGISDREAFERKLSAQVETGARKDLGGFHLPEGGTEVLQTPHQVADELGKAIDRFGSWTSASGPSSSRRPIQEAMVSGLT
jgi:hypothetical protein